MKLAWLKWPTHVLIHGQWWSIFITHLHKTIKKNRGIKITYFFNKFPLSNRLASNEMLQSAASHLGLYCFPMSDAKEVKIIGVKYMGSFPTVLFREISQSFERFFVCVNLAINISINK